MHNYNAELGALMLGQVDEDPCAGLPPEMVYNPTTDRCEWPAQACPGAERWNAEIGACMCPPGTTPTGIVGECKGAATPTTPGAVPVVCGAWDGSNYRLQAGDTYVGLAATYLGDGARWQEIWTLNKSQHPNPSVIFAGQVIKMPASAEKTKAKKCGELPPSIKKALPWVLIGVVGAVGTVAVIKAME